MLRLGTFYLRSETGRKTGTSTTFEAIGWLQAWTLCKHKQLNPKVEGVLTTTFCFTQGKVIKQYVFRVKQKTSTTYLSLLTKLVQSKIVIPVKTPFTIRLASKSSSISIFDLFVFCFAALHHVEKRRAKEFAPTYCSARELSAKQRQTLHFLRKSKRMNPKFDPRMFTCYCNLVLAKHARPLLHT